MVEKKRVPRCEGKRHQFRGNGYGDFKCGRKATGYVTTKDIAVGVREEAVKRYRKSRKSRW